MSQVASGGKSKSKQPSGLQDSIESEPTKGNKSRRKATSATSKQKGDTSDCKALDSFTLIDTAKVAAATTVTATGNDHHRELQAVDPVQVRGGGEGGGGGGTPVKGITKSALPIEKVGDKFDASDCYQENEVNNNSIPSSESQAIGASSIASTSTRVNPTEITPLSLLTGLRMHTSNLKSQQPKQQQSTGTSATATASAGDDSGDPKKVPSKGDKQAHEASGTLSPAPFVVESTLNPKPSPIGAHTSANSLSPRLNLDSRTAYIPSYSSIFSQNSNKSANNTPALMSSPLTTPDNLECHKISSSTTSSVQKQHLLSESTTIRETTTATTNTGRGPLVKQQATTTSPRDLSPRSLFLTSSGSKSGQYNTTNSDNQRLPSIFDHSTGRLKEPRNYDDYLSTRGPVQRLVDGDIDDIVDYDNDDGQDSNSVQEDDQRVTPDSYILRKTSRNSTNNLRTNDSSFLIDSKNPVGERKIPVASLSPEYSDLRDQQLKQAHNQLNHHQRPKYPGSSSRLTQPSLSDRTASLRVKISQAQRQGSKKYQQHQLPQAQHSRAMTNDLSRPPSFNTTTCQQQQEHDAKVASCRKLNLLEQVAHLDCNCEICSRGRELASIQNNDLFHYNSDSRSKLSNFNLNSHGEKNYPRTRFVHMVLKSIILVLCTLLLLLLLVGTILITHYLPQSMEKVMNVSRSFNVTIAGRR